MKTAKLNWDVLGIGAKIEHSVVIDGAIKLAAAALNCGDAIAIQHDAANLEPREISYAIGAWRLVAETSQLIWNHAL